MNKLISHLSYVENERRVRNEQEITLKRLSWAQLWDL